MRSGECEVGKTATTVWRLKLVAALITVRSEGDVFLWCYSVNRNYINI